MSVFRIVKENCINCYKCLRGCPVKAIDFAEHGVQISEERCVECGACHDGCGHNAILTMDDLERTRQLIATGRNVIVSLDPSCLGSFPVKSVEQMVAAIKRLGFWGVADTSTGAAAVALEYNRIACDGKMENVITTSCPAVCSLVEKFYPELIGCLAPVVSPMIAHGRMLKQRYPGVGVVYVGSCLARYDESRDVRHSTEVNAVLSYSELARWLEEEGVDPSKLEGEPLLEPASSAGRLYPLEGGMLSLISLFGDDLLYRKIAISGMENCMDMLQAMKSHEVSGYLVEMNACRSACINGSARVKNGKPMFATRLRMEEYVEAHQRPEIYPDAGVSLACPPINRRIKERMPTEDEIRQVLYSMGMDDPAWAVNCGACGYSSCREKAIAVLQNRSELSMCFTSLRRRAESISNFVLDEIPMIVIIVDQKQRIVEFNKEAVLAFGIERSAALKKYIFDLISPEDFLYVLDTGIAIKNKPLTIHEYKLRVEASIVYIKSQQVALGVFKDITAQEAKAERELEQRLKSVDMAQQVIDKQMMVAQQIASLLGETTAETKVTLNSLKNQILKDGD